MRSTALTLAARYVFPVEGPPIADGLLTIESGRIASVGPRDGRTGRPRPRQRRRSLPGFVNAHTHLELSPGRRPAGATDPRTRSAWLRRVIDQRAGGPGRGAPRRRSAGTSRRALAAGTTLLADTTTAGLSWDQVAAAPVRAVVFAELIGLKRDRGLQTNDEAWAWIGTVGPEAQVAACARPGLSPHAPYSTVGLALPARRRRAGCRSRPTWPRCPRSWSCWRPATGPLRGFLEDLGAWDDDWEPIGPRPADYVRKGDLRKADWLIAHGTYLDPSEFWQLRPEAAPDGHRVAVAYCPRTHARFGHAPHPYRAMLERGVVVCLGTDSLASAPTPERPRRGPLPPPPRRLARAAPCS